MGIISSSSVSTLGFSFPSGGGKFWEEGKKKEGGKEARVSPRGERRGDGIGSGPAADLLV